MLDLFGTDKKKRKGFSSSQKVEIITRQNNKCKRCKTPFNKNRRPHFDHKDENRNNNKTSNGQALCANCHDVKSLHETKRRNKNSEPKTDLDFLINSGSGKSNLDYLTGKHSKKSDIDYLLDKPRKNKFSFLDY